MYMSCALSWISSQSDNGFMQNFDYSWLVDEIKRNLPKELDFVNEAKNAEQCRKNLQSSKSRVRGR